MVEINKIDDFIPNGVSDRKIQIILSHTSREFNNYLNGLYYRYNKKYDRIPHYVITREGEVHKFLENDEYSLYFNDLVTNKLSINICLENLGWLQKEPLTNYYVNWIGEKYDGVVYERRWRDYYFWQPYTGIQFNVLIELCQKICDDNKINNISIGHNTKISGAKAYKGIVCRSNFSVIATDVSPAFDFENFSNNLNG